NQPGTYQDVTDTTVVAQFKAKAESLPSFLQNEGDIYFLAWTTTPWTLPSNTALTVGPKIEYVLVETYNQYTFEPIKVVIAKKLLSYQFSGKFLNLEGLNKNFGGIRYNNASPEVQKVMQGYYKSSILKDENLSEDDLHDELS